MPSRKPLTVAQAAKEGTHRELLVAMRDRIAETVTGDCPARDLASLSRRLQDIAREIDAIDKQAREEGIDPEGGDIDYTFDPETV